MVTKKKAAATSKKSKSTKTRTAKHRGKVVTVTTTTTTVLTPTRIALVIDASGSMKTLKTATIKMANSLLSDFRENDPTAEITVVYFGVGTESRIEIPIHRAGLSQVREISANTYNPEGMTPLYDGVARAVEAIDGTDEFTYMVYVISDGDENHSSMTANRFADLVQRKQATDIWTFAFVIPKYAVSEFIAKSGVHAGNVTFWDISDNGLKTLSHSNSTSVKKYYNLRSTGTRGSSNFFTTDLSSLTKRDFASLPDVSKDFKVWTVDQETDIRTFVEVEKGLSFVVGNGYYSLQKKETVQPQKEILLMRKGTKEIKADGRSVLGLPDYEVPVVPGNHADYDIYVQSTSNNRKLPRGSKLLWRIR